MNISWVLLSLPKSTRQDLAWAPRAASSLTDQVHSPSPATSPSALRGPYTAPPRPTRKGSRRQLDPWGKASQGRHSPTVLLWDIGTDPVLGTQEAISHGAR